jgi:hypothetical protein
VLITLTHWTQCQAAALLDLQSAALCHVQPGNGGQCLTCTAALNTAVCCCSRLQVANNVRGSTKDTADKARDTASKATGELTY